MKLHRRARLSWTRRLELVEQAQAMNEPNFAALGRAFGVSGHTAKKWVKRYEAEGPRGLEDRSSAPRHVANKTPVGRVEAIVALRKIRMTGAEIAELLKMPDTTVSGLLTRLGLGRLGRLGMAPAVRYERERPGELIHIDVKKLGRIARPGHRITGTAGKRQAGYHRRAYEQGWEFVHIAIDDATRLAYAEVLTDEKATTAVAFLHRAIAFYERHGITVQRLMTDNGPAYRSRVHAIACRAMRIRHLRTRPYRPQTNGKAERFIRTMLDGWAYAAIYRTSAERTAALDGWLHHYNHHRRHAALSRQTPAQRLNNLLGSYT